MMTVEGLKPGTTYVFRVRARTDGGYGSYGGEIELETSHEGKERQGIVGLFSIQVTEVRPGSLQLFSLISFFKVPLFIYLFFIYLLSSTFIMASLRASAP